MNVSFIIAIVSILIATASFFITLLNFKRQRTIDNQNQLFNLKVQLYNSINKRFAQLITVYENASFDANTTDAHGRERLADTISYINKVFKKPLNKGSLEKYFIEDPKFPLTFLTLIETYLNFVIEKGIAKS